MPRLPRSELRPRARGVHVHGRLRRARAEDRLAAVLDHGQLPDADAPEQRHRDAARRSLDHELTARGCGWTGTPLSFSATAWP